MEYFVFRFLTTHFFCQSLEYVMQRYFYFLVLLLKSDLCHNYGSYLERTKTYKFLYVLLTV